MNPAGGGNGSQGSRLGSALLSSARSWLLVIVVGSVIGMASLPSRGFGQAASGNWMAGAEVLFLEASFANDLAIRRAEEDLLGNAELRDFNFDQGLSAAPRTWIEYQSAYDIGARASWWMLNSASDPLVLNPPLNGFGELTHPPLFGIDLSSVIPAESLVASTELDLHVIDLEVTKRMLFTSWQIEMSAGLRYAGIEQQSVWSLRNAANQLAGNASWDQETTGIGPTFRVASRRLAFNDLLALEAGLRASLLRAEIDTLVEGGEDLDLPTPFTTSYRDDREDLLPIVELRFGGQVSLAPLGLKRIVMGAGIESQWWSGVGTASDVSADLGLHGFYLSASALW